MGNIKTYNDVLNYFTLLGTPITVYSKSVVNKIIKILKQHDIINNRVIINELYTDIIRVTYKETACENSTHASNIAVLISKLYDKFSYLPSNLLKFDLETVLKTELSSLKCVSIYTSVGSVFCRHTEPNLLKILIMDLKYKIINTQIIYLNNYTRNTLQNLLYLHAQLDMRNYDIISNSGNLYCVIPFLLDLSLYPEFKNKFRMGKNLIFRDTYKVMNLLEDNPDIVVSNSIFLKNIKFLDSLNLIKEELFKDMVNNIIHKYSTRIYEN